MSEPKYDAAEVLASLVNQFAEPLSFLRELVQNSVDAGSPLVEVHAEYLDPPAGSGDPGVAVLHVDDYGEGMDRHIIDTKLTRLFSSGKDGDYTKIGRFGIGFVSVFAIQPDAVCVDTSRGGEHWRVLFDRDRTFRCIARPTPVDGTQIRILKAMPRTEYEALLTRAREVLIHWCRYLTVELRFQGEPVNQPLDLDLPCRVHYREAGTELVVGPTRDGSTFAGYYNRGLTLLEEPAGPWPGFAFRINSRYLEHTLTRDNVIRDQQYERALELVRRQLEEVLPVELLRQIEAAVLEPGAAPAPELAPLTAPAPLDDLYQGLGRFLALGLPLGDAVTARILCRSTTGRPVSVLEWLQACQARRCGWEEVGSPVAAALERDGWTVAATTAGTPLLACLTALCPPAASWDGTPRADGRVPRVGELFGLPRREPDAAQDEIATALPALLLRLLRGLGARTELVEWGDFDYVGSAIREQVAVTLAEPDVAAPLTECTTLSFSRFSRRRIVVLNRQHPTVRDLLTLARAEPELAAYLLAKLFFLAREFPVQRDGRLASLALEERCRRPTV